MAKTGIPQKFWGDLMLTILEDEGFTTGKRTQEFVKGAISDVKEMLEALSALEMYRVR